MTADESPTIRELRSRVHDRLRATEELPIDPRANRWLGEAHAVAADLDREDIPEDAARERAGQVCDLLSSAGSTGDPEADEHVTAAREMAAEIGRRLDEK